jgi:DNA-binding MarR family transcriptional regulator
MEKNGLIERDTSLVDARIKKIKLNPKTEEIFNEKEKRLEELESIVLENISKDDLEVFSNVLKKMKENIKNYENVAVRKD